MPCQICKAEFLCIKGRYAFDFSHHPERLQSPLVRKKGKLEPVAWSEALEVVGKKFAEVRDRKGKFGVIGSNYTTNEENYYLRKFATEILHTPHVDHHRTGDVMTSDCLTVNQRSSLYEVGRKQVDFGMRPLPVVDDEGRLRGIAEAQDFAKVFFEGLEADLADQIPIDLENVAHALDARVLVAAPDRSVRDRVVVAASSSETVIQRLEPEIVPEPAPAVEPGTVFVAA